jgi:hypothetical protein
MALAAAQNSHCCAYARAMNLRGGKMVAFLLGGLVLCLYGQALNLYCGYLREFEAALLPIQWMQMVCIVILCVFFIFLAFSLIDLPLIGLLFIVIAAYFIGYTASQSAMDAIILLMGMTLGRGARFFFENQKSEIRNFLIGVVVLLAFSSWWYLDMTGAYHGPRWMGLWNNPNIYAMLMGTGVLLAVGLLAQNQKSEAKSQKLLTINLFIAAGMMGIGLFFSYSRGAWFGTAVGLLYLAKAHGKFKWRFVLPGIVVVAAVVAFFWHSTLDTDQWYLKRLDLSRPSAQHRVSAWRGAFQMMRDHPLGVGWNKAVGVYEKNYSPPEGGAAALTMNSYFMLGTELGLPGLVCFVAYIWLSLRRKIDRLEAYPTLACRAGALALLVAFWFDGGLFTLATASVFWILLELGTSNSINFTARTIHQRFSG